MHGGDPIAAGRQQMGDVMQVLCTLAGAMDFTRFRRQISASHSGCFAAQREAFSYRGIDRERLGLDGRDGRGVCLPDFH